MILQDGDSELTPQELAGTLQSGIMKPHPFSLKKTPHIIVFSGKHGIGWVKTPEFTQGDFFSNFAASVTYMNKHASGEKCPNLCGDNYRQNVGSKRTQTLQKGLHFEWEKNIQISPQKV